MSNAGPDGSTLRLTADPALLDGSAGSFRIVGGTCSDGVTLTTAGEPCTVTIEFKPTATGDQRATLAIADNVGAPDKVQLTGAGQDPPFQGPR